MDVPPELFDVLVQPVPPEHLEAYLDQHRVS